ncbi:MAG: DegT/DnrJ/EryC1/StrS family aminotransferase [Acidobacteria bacterium]|nr:DegT/DnrJ/EryC1/StrS family aminotransferase [Acidobacteriota bacterium]
MRFQVSKPVLAGREKEYVMDALDSGWISGSGGYVERFEKAVSEFLGCDGGVAVVNGTAALHLALLALGARPGTKVIVPAFTYVACPNAVRYCGAQPVFADCDPFTWNVTRQAVEACLSPRTAGVLLVHLFGLPADVASIAELCRERGLWLLEDCAQSLGARQNHLPTGRFGDMAAFSFYGNKVASSGEGGMVFARDPAMRPLLRELRNQGLSSAQHHWHGVIGFNYRMSNLLAAIGCAQMEMIDHHIRERRRIASRYISRLQPLQASGTIRLPVEPPGCDRIFWLFGFVLETGSRHTKDRIRDRLLQEYGIQTRPFYVPMHRLPMYAQDGAFPNAEFLGDHGIVLPTYSGLSSEEIDEISDAVAGIIQEELACG